MHNQVEIFGKAEEIDHRSQCMERCVYSELDLDRETEEVFGRVSPLYEEWILLKGEGVLHCGIGNPAIPLKIGETEWQISDAAEGGGTVNCTTDLAVPARWRILFLTGKTLRLRVQLGAQEKRPPHEERYYASGGEMSRTVPELILKIHRYDELKWTPETFYNVKIRFRSTIVHELTHFDDERLPAMNPKRPDITVGTDSIAQQLNYLINPTELRAKVRDQVEAAIQRDIPFGAQLKIHLGRVRQVMSRHRPGYRPGLDSPTCAPETIDASTNDAITALNKAYREEFIRRYPRYESELGDPGDLAFHAPSPFA
jgi:hypothetical protein